MKSFNQHLDSITILEQTKNSNYYLFEINEGDNVILINSIKTIINRKKNIDDKLRYIETEKSKVLEYLEKPEIAKKISEYNLSFGKKRQLFQNKLISSKLVNGSNDTDYKSLELFRDNNKKYDKIFDDAPNIISDFFAENLKGKLEKDETETIECFNIYFNEKFNNVSDEEFQKVWLNLRNYSNLGNTSKEDIEILKIHSQERYFDLLVDLESEIETSKETEPINDNQTSKNYVPPNRKKNDSMTVLSNTQTFYLFKALQKSKVILSNSYLNDTQLAKEVNSLTGYSSNTLVNKSDNIEGDKEATLEILKKIIKLINK